MNTTMGMENKVDRIEGNCGGKSILFLEKVFLRRAPAVLRGVELFNLNLLRDLDGLGHETVIFADSSWRGILDESLSSSRRISVNYGSGALRLLGWSVALLRGRRYDVMLLGNVGNLLVPLVRAVKLSRRASRIVLIAHRETSRRFLAALRGLDSAIVCVNGKIAEPFIEAGFKTVAIDYGIMNAPDFHPRETAREAGARVKFCVVGMLDNAWKGADTATAAFRAMPENARSASELHLASFSEPPEYPGENIFAHPWMPASEIPGWLRGMDVMLCPSRDEIVMSETFSQAIVQGMLTGLPVLASGLEIFREKLDKGGGEIYDNVGDLSVKMAALAADPELRARLGAEGRAVALDRYVWDTSRFVSRYFGV